MKNGHTGLACGRITPMLALVIFTAASFFATACSTTPTGRSQVALFSQEQVDAAGEDAFAEFKSTATLITSGPLYDAVQKVGNRIARVAPSQAGGWEIVLVDTTVVNAFAVPGGGIAIYKGIIPMARTEGGLGSIIGHEMAHVMSNHGNERASQAALAGILVDVAGSEAGEGWGTVFGIGATVGVLLPYSRTHESEADEIGIRLLAQAGYNPEAAPEVWDRMAAESGGRGGPTFLSTHPDPAARAERLRELVPEMRPIYNAASPKYVAEALLPTVQ